MSYTVEISTLAARQIKKFSPDIQQLVLAELAGLAAQPRPDGVTKLKGEDNVYRVRVKNIASSTKFLMTSLLFWWAERLIAVRCIARINLELYSIVPALCAEISPKALPRHI